MTTNDMEWLANTFRTYNIDDARVCALQLHTHLSSCKSVAQLVQYRERVKEIIDKCNTVLPLIDMETLVDEIISHYHLIAVTNCNAASEKQNDSEDSGVCSSPVDKNYDVAFPPLNEEKSKKNYDMSNDCAVVEEILLVSSDDEVYDEQIIEEKAVDTSIDSDCSVQNNKTFDGSDSARFVVPKGNAPKPPMLKIGSLPTRIGPGWYPQLPTRNRQRYVSCSVVQPTFLVPHQQTVVSQRVRQCSATYDNRDIVGFCVPRVVECEQNDMMDNAFVPVNARTHFTPIRSESMSWAYDVKKAKKVDDVDDYLLRHEDKKNKAVGFKADDALKRARTSPTLTTSDSVSQWHQTHASSLDAWLASVIRETDQNIASDVSPHYIASPASPAPDAWPSTAWSHNYAINTSTSTQATNMEDASDRLEDEQLLSFVGSIASVAPLGDD
jgi:hypothetical protein